MSLRGLEGSPGLAGCLALKQVLCLLQTPPLASKRRVPMAKPVQPPAPPPAPGEPRGEGRRRLDAFTCEVKPSGRGQTDRQASHAGLCEPRPGGGGFPGRRTGKGERPVFANRAGLRGDCLIQLAAGTGQTGHTGLPGFPAAGPARRAIPNPGCPRNGICRMGFSVPGISDGCPILRFAFFKIFFFFRPSASLNEQSFGCEQRLSYKSCVWLPCVSASLKQRAKEISCVHRARCKVR